MDALGNGQVTRRATTQVERELQRRAKREVNDRRAEIRLIAAGAILTGAIAVFVLIKESLFPVPKEQLVEVAWKHECSCAQGWMQSLRARGFTVNDYELDDTSTQRQRWHLPDSIQGCHPATYLGYFLDGHVSANALHQLARERPKAIGLQQVDTVESDASGTQRVISSQLLLISSSGAATPWPVKANDESEGRR